MKKQFLKNRQINLRHYALVFLLIACSGFPTFIFTPSFSYSMLFIFSLLNFIKEKQNIDNYFLILLGIIFLFSFIQFLQFDLFSFETIGSQFILYLGSYFLIKSVGIDFLSIYVRVLKVLALISFLFYFLVVFTPHLIEFIINDIAPIFQEETGTYFVHSPTIVLYTFNLDTENFGIPRNSGPFWEPGAFAGFLILGIIFNIILEKKVFSKITIIFIVSVITTFSTTGYIALSFLLFSYYLLSVRPLFKLLILPVFLIISTYSYNNIPFLGEKIDAQFNTLSISGADYQYRTRFVSTVLDFYDFIEYPIFGRGKNEETRFSNYGVNTGLLKHRNNGVTDFLVQFGALGFVLYFGSIFLSFKSLIEYYKKQKGLVSAILVTIIIIGLSEKYFNRPFFISLIFPFIWQYSKKIISTKVKFLNE